MKTTNDVSRAEFTEFCNRHHANLVGLLGLFCGSRELGEEFAQETLMRAYRDWSKVRTYDAPAAWLYRVGTNLARSHFRRNRAEAKARGRLQREPAPSTNEPTTVLEMREAIVQLPPRMRAALVLRYYGGLQITEVAEAMDCSASTVKKLLRRALIRLREQERVISGRETCDAS